ncbi:MAG: hypothetical protein QOG71_3907 [Pyrinomonadaceae bacterium]|nr:hypothetical protein [Pyrinomonadaceae bacterium]
MLLRDLYANSGPATQYLERYVNDGSPSGFTAVNTTSPLTSPFGLNPWFNLYICTAPIERVKTFGQIPVYPVDGLCDHDNWIFVHPDMVSRLSKLSGPYTIFRCDRLKVMPTASGRTVQIINYPGQDYVKLHYDGLLGRIRRDLPYKKAIAGPELARIIITAIDNGVLNNKLTLLPESGARTVVLSSSSEMTECGMIWRDNRPYGLDIARAKYVIPMFSLFSYDRLSIHHPPLLKQILDERRSDPVDYVHEVLIAPLIRCYFDLIGMLGILPEWNSQNVLVAFNNDFSDASFVMRDLESCDRDLTLMSMLRLPYDCECHPYKCIDETQPHYTIKHSFMFDFKLGECILEPLLTLLHEYYDVDMAAERHRVSEVVREVSGKLPANYFPKDKWYSLDNVVYDIDDKARPYVEHTNPKFRS